MSIRPLRDKIVIEPAVKKDKSAGGIIIPDTVKDGSNMGVVISVGTGILGREGDIIPLAVSPGDKVLYGKNHSGTEVDIDGKKCLIMSELEVIAVIE
jgi:chaperonin GroES